MKKTKKTKKTKAKATAKYTIGGFTITAKYEPTALSDGSGGIASDELGRVEFRVSRALLLCSPVLEGEALKFVRKTMGLRQPDLASLLDVTVTTVSRWETGTEPIRRQTQLALLQLLESAAQSESGTPTPIGTLEAQNDASGVKVVAA